MAAPRNFKPRKPKYVGSVPVGSTESQTENRASRNRGRLSTAELDTVNALVRLSPGGMSKEQIAATAIALKRSRAAIVAAVESAQSKLQKNAERYVDIHLEAAEAALATCDYDVARKAAEFALKNVSAKRDDGSTARVIDLETADTKSGPQFKIGIALGGMAAAPKETVDAEVITQSNVAND